MASTEYRVCPASRPVTRAPWRVGLGSFSSFLLLGAWFGGGAGGNRFEGRHDWVEESIHRSDENITTKAGISQALTDTLGTILCFQSLRYLSSGNSDSFYRRHREHPRSTGGVGCHPAQYAISATLDKATRPHVTILPYAVIVKTL